VFEEPARMAGGPMATGPMVVPDNRSIALGNLILFGVPLLAVGFGTTLLIDHHNPLSPGWLSAFVSADIAMAAFAVWLTTMMFSDHGIQLTDEGVLVYGRALGTAGREPRLYAWDRISEVYMNGFLNERFTVGLDRPLWMLVMSAPEAAALLSHPKCPIRSALPEKIAKRLRIRPA
jgi:hypothetical protein